MTRPDAADDPVAGVVLTPEERERAADALENAADLVQPESDPSASGG
ncbi:hypothetical protein [Cryptosporangium arvum]|nr:hypothetical protein [Cryptosporangium arvum]